MISRRFLAAMCGIVGSALWVAPQGAAQPSPPAADSGTAGSVSCETRAAWGDPHPSVVILRRLTPECDIAEVQVIRTNGQAYPAQCVPFRGGKIAVTTATGDYHLEVRAGILTGDFVSKVDPAFSRIALIWQCDKPIATISAPPPAALQQEPSRRP